METKQDYEIRQAIEAIREYIGILIKAEEQQSDIADKLPYEIMIEDLSMAIYKLEAEKGKEKSVRLTTAVWFSSEIKKLHTNYLPGSVCYVIQDDDFYILNKNHKWVKIYEE